MSPKNTAAPGRGKPKYKCIPAGLTPSQLEDIDAIAQAEKMTRSEVIRKAIEAFTVNYKTDRLDQRQIQLEKKMQAMEKGMRALLVKSIRLNGQVLYFATLPWTQGMPKQRLNDAGFQMLYDKSADFAAQFLKSKAAGLVMEESEPACRDDEDLMTE